MNFIIESQRRNHELIERIEDSIVSEIIAKPRNHWEKLVQQHRIYSQLKKIKEASEILHESYNDSLGERQAEITQISNPTDFTNFYNSLKLIKEHHRKFPSEEVEVLEIEVEKKNEFEYEDLEKLFTGEEMRGRFLDLNSLYSTYVNLKNIPKISYLTYLGIFEDFKHVPADTKKTTAYKNYLIELLEYLKGFCQRTSPLVNTDRIEDDAQEDLKKTLQQEGSSDFFCKPCAKQFSKESVFKGHLSGKKHIKAAESYMETSESSPLPIDQTLSLEYKIQKYTETLHSQREETREIVERKQALTSIEIDEMRGKFQMQDWGKEEEVIYSDEEEDEDAADTGEIYNPLKLPMGFDGKPIPYWLFKLHGLGVEHSCEICGNYVYMGRKAFERHFQDARHAHGMRCLGIPNTRHFQDVTSIADAFSLWELLKKKTKADLSKAEAMEEFEDADGNVFNKKTFEDLRRQGLL